MCSANYYCTSTTQTACNPGSYSFEGSSSCEPCPSGYRCPGSGSDPVICIAGTYATNGSDSCSQCDIGYSCPVDGMSSPSLCPAGLIFNFYLKETHLFYERKKKVIITL